jgi:phosphoribosylamine--glycine ligase
VKVLVVGSGGREHALAWKLVGSPSLTALHAAPGNSGIAALGDCHPVRAEDSEGLLTLAGSLGVDLVVVGPEAPLVAGVADELRHSGFAVFGPGALAAAIEGSKSFAKDVMQAAGVATASSMAIARAPCVIKADGLAAGKGVVVCRTQEELDAGLAELSALGDSLVIETTSAHSTAMRGQTRVGWGRTLRCLGSARRSPPTWSSRCIAPS